MVKKADLKGGKWELVIGARFLWPLCNNRGDSRLCNNCHSEQREESQTP